MFADEIAGANMAYRDSALTTGSLPEQVQDLPRMVAPTAMTLQKRMHIPNRFFADEIAAGADWMSWGAPDMPGMLPPQGPR